MTTTTTPIAPTADVVGLARRFNVAAITNAFGADALFGRYQELRIGSANHDPDMLAGLRFSAVLDLLLDYRARGDRSFDVLAVKR